MDQVRIEAGKSYRLKRPLEIRDEKTGTMRYYFHGATILTVRKVAYEEDRVWFEGAQTPVPLTPLSRMVDPVA